MREQHLGVAEHRQHLQGGDRQVFPQPRSTNRDARRLLSGLHKQGTGQRLVADRRQHHAQQISDQAALDRAAGLTTTGTGVAAQRTPEAHHQPALPKAVEQHQEGEGRQRQPRTQSQGAIGVPTEAAAHIVEGEHPHHNDAEGGLNPEPNPGHALQS